MELKYGTVPEKKEALVTLQLIIMFVKYKKYKVVYVYITHIVTNIQTQKAKNCAQKIFFVILSISCFYTVSYSYDVHICMFILNIFKSFTFKWCGKGFLKSKSCFL